MPSATRVFFSYSARDWVLARLIIKIFEQNGIECFFADRDLITGDTFDEEIVRKIWNSNLLLVLLTPQSEGSMWVQHEVGIATGQDIPVWPLVIDDRVSVQGAIYRRRGFYFSKHTDPHEQIAMLATEINRASTGKKTGTLKPVLDQYVFSKIERTKQLVKTLEEEEARAAHDYVWRIRATFSSFSFSTDPAFAKYYESEYLDLLMKEFGAAQRLSNKATLRVIVWPRFPYDNEELPYVRLRLATLVNWLETNRDYDRIRFVVTSSAHGNVNICDRNILIEGVRVPDFRTRGYQLTTVTTYGPAIAAAIVSFDTHFEALWADHVRECQSTDQQRAMDVRLCVVAQLRSTLAQIDEARSGQRG